MMATSIWEPRGHARLDPHPSPRTLPRRLPSRPQHGCPPSLSRHCPPAAAVTRALYGNFLTLFPDHLSRIPQHFTALYTPCDVFYLGC